MMIMTLGTGPIGKKYIKNIKSLKPKSNFIFIRQGARHEALSELLQAEVLPDMKEGVFSLTYLTTYWGKNNIRVNALPPGGIYNGQNKFFKKSIVTESLYIVWVNLKTPLVP